LFFLPHLAVPLIRRLMWFGVCLVVSSGRVWKRPPGGNHLVSSALLGALRVVVLGHQSPVILNTRLAAMSRRLVPAACRRDATEALPALCQVPGQGPQGKPAWGSGSRQDTRHPQCVSMGGIQLTLVRPSWREDKQALRKRAEAVDCQRSFGCCLASLHQETHVEQHMTGGDMPHSASRGSNLMSYLKTRSLRRVSIAGNSMEIT
jgi:hypothetical protein